MRKHLLIVGGGHAHMTVMKHIDRFITDGHRVTVVSSSAHHYYSGMGPGMLSGIYRPEEIRFNVKQMVEERGGYFVIGEVVRIEPNRKAIALRSGETLNYDVASFNTGSFVPIDESLRSSKNVFTVKPIEKLLSAQVKISAALKERELRLVVAGGGPAGVEIAGNLNRLVEDQGGTAQITLVTGSGLLNGFSRRVRQAAAASFSKRGIQMIQKAYVERFDNGQLVVSDGSRIDCDYLIFAAGVKPSGLFADSGLPTGGDGGLLVNEYLQSVAYPQIFGGGDCISFEPGPLDKVGVYAVRQNPILLHNLSAALNQNDFVKFVPQQKYLLAFNLGDGSAILSWKGFLLKGRLGFFIKDHIDQKFMRAFQVSGERDQIEALLH